MQFTVSPGGALTGEVRVPGDKSISHRAVMLGALARGTTPPASRAFAYSPARLAGAIVLAVALEYAAFRDALILGL